MEDFLRNLGITISGTYTDEGAYSIDIRDDREYSRIFNLLEKSSKVEQLEDTSTVNYENANVMFGSDNYILNLIADWDNNIYKLVCTEV